MTLKELQDKFLGKKIYSKKFWNPQILHMHIKHVEINESGKVTLKTTMYNNHSKYEDSWTFGVDEDWRDWHIIQDKPKSHLPDFL